MPDISDLIPKNILVITAHPDDESYFGAGTTHANKLAGGTTNLICATLGEKGSLHLDKPVTEEELKSIRHQELKNATDVSGINRVIILDMPDGGVSDHKQEIIDKINALIPELHPEVILSFGPDGITGHRDHIAISEVAAEIAKQHHLSLAMCCVPDEILEEAHDWLMQRRRTKGHYADDFKLCKGNLEIKIDGNIKIQALKSFKSQIDNDDPFYGFPENIAEALSTTESFNLR